MSTLMHDILHEVASPAIGCTEPVAIALAAATACEAIGGIVEQVKVLIDPYTFKNAMAVAIPNTGGESGICFAAALGALYGNPGLKLETLRDIRQEDMKVVKQMVYQSRVQVDMLPYQLPIHIEATVETSQGRGRAIINGSHTNVTFIEANGKVKLGDKSTAAEPHEAVCNRLLAMKIPQIIRLTANLKSEDIQFLLKGAQMNMAIAREGLSKRLGLAVGANFQDMIEKGLISDNEVNKAKILTAGAIDARMSGSSLPVMTNCGSGNQGIATILPIVVVSAKMKSGRLELARALALGHLFAAYTRLKIGELCTMCGSAIGSAVGASVGILWLIDKREELVEKVINNVVGNISGILCDGANERCALKLATACGVAIETALLTSQHMEVVAKGIIANSAEETLNRLGLISKSMRETEKAILNVMGNT